jgi:uncharacterized repeat protein (TIGR03803 family)
VKSQTPRHYALSVSAAALLAGCGGSQLPIGAPGIAPPSLAYAAAAAPAGTGKLRPVKVLYNFKKHDDGHDPEASLLDVHGTLYGTTAWGGSSGEGTVFAISGSGNERVLHSFGSHDDGAVPVAGLVAVHGALYGTTTRGGAYLCQSLRICGTVFSIDRTGRERVLHSFGSGTDGYEPAASLLNVGGTLYGTTVYGGAYDGGTVFSISTTGVEKVLYSFAGSKGDGCEPWAGLTEVNGTLYGTTSNCGAYTRGTVFSISTSGSEKVLHSFGYGSDGSYPVTGLINVSGTLYGTAQSGTSGNGNGAVFSITTTGNEQVFYNFDYPAGANPSALTDVNGTFYGTATGGPDDEGFIFSVTPYGDERLVHEFTRRGGSGPLASLIYVDGTLFGTTAYGGRTVSGHGGFGTVFSLGPSR